MAKKLLRDGGVYTLCHHLITCLMEEKDLDIESVQKLRIVDFWQWVIARFNENETAFPDRDELETHYDVADEHFVDFHDMLQNPFVFCGMMMSWWPKLIIRERPPRHKIMGICLTAAIQFEPENPGEYPRAFQMPLPIWYPQNTDVPFNTAGILGLWQVQMTQIIDLILRHGGTDGIYQAFCTKEGAEIPVEFQKARPGGFGF